MFGGRDFPPIHDRPALLTFVRAQLDRDGRLPDPTCTLPDETPTSPDTVSWMAGALDGVLGHHGGDEGAAAEAAERLARAIADAARRPRRRQLTALYELASSGDVLSLVDPTIEALARLRPDTAKVAEIGTWLASTAPDRGPVKLGIALLGVTGAPDGSLLHELGAHEELTLYAAVAFCNARQDPEPDLFALARRVDGWGRIHCVERLRRTTTPEIARWILLEGFRNRVMDEYLAHIAATTGRLADALAVPTPNRTVLTAAGDIIDALIMGGPAEDIDDYPDAPAVLARWLDLIGTRLDTPAEVTVLDLRTIIAIRSFCDQTGWDARIAAGRWTAAQRATIRARADALVGHSRWPDLVRAGLDDADPHRFFHAERAAGVLGIDAFERLLARIDADPFGGPWYQAWQGVDRDRALVLAERAARLLDLDAIATGPTTAIGMGPQFRPHSALGWSLQHQRRHPGVGADLLAAALWSPSIQNRNGALATLEAWSTSFWNDAHRTRLRQLATADPDDKIRERAAALLARDA